MQAIVDIAGARVSIDLAHPADLSIATGFDGAGPRHFGAPRPVSQPFAIGTFTGEVATGASCNCRTITLTPQCTGTHTECAGHLTREALDAWRVAPSGLLPARLISVTPCAASSSTDRIVPVPEDDDLVVDADALAPALAATAPFRANALIVRTLPNALAKRSRDYTTLVAPYLTVSAVEAIVEAGIEHLVLDVPSLDRTHDEGRLAGHRVFFGMPEAGASLESARRPHATITELAFIPDALADGPCLLQLQVAPIDGDAAPSRPMIFPCPTT